MEKLRIDVAAFGKPDAEDSEGGQPVTSMDGRRAAEDAVRRAAGALEFADPEDRAVREFRMLYEAVVPLILTKRLVG